MKFLRQFKVLTLVTAVTATFSMSAQAETETLRLLTWGGYAPQNVVEQFEKETGIEVKITLSNNEGMISKLRATRGAGFDLAQPSQDRIVSAQADFNIYKPMDLSKIDTANIIPPCWQRLKRTPILTAKCTVFRTFGAPVA